MADVFYSKADQEALDRGEPLPEKGTLTPEDYKALLELALSEAVEGSSAKDLISQAGITDYYGQYAGLTTAEVGQDGKLTGKYTVGVDWGTRMEARVMDPKYGMAYAAQRFSTVFHEVRHVEQKAMMRGDLQPGDKLDAEIVTQMTVNDLYPSVYKRGYGNTISEVDADVEGLRGAVAFFDRHPEIKDRYGFDFRKEIMLTDEYDLLEDKFQVTEATPEDLLKEMETFRGNIYDDAWLPEGERTLSMDGATYGELTKSEKTLMENLEETRGITFEDLEGMTNDQRNVLLIDNAKSVIEDPNKRIAPNLEEYADGIVMETRCDEYVVLLNGMQAPDEYDFQNIAGVEGLGIDDIGTEGGQRPINGVAQRLNSMKTFVYQHGTVLPGAVSIPPIGPVRGPYGSVGPAAYDKGGETRRPFEGKGKGSRRQGFSDIVSLTILDAGDKELC